MYRINAQFPDVFTEDDRVILDMVVKQVVQNPSGRQKSMAKENDFAMFNQSLFPKEFEDMVIKLAQISNDTFTKMFANQGVYDFIREISAQEAYKKWRSDEAIGVD